MKNFNIIDIYCKPMTETISSVHLQTNKRQKSKILKFLKSKRMDVFLQKIKLILQEKLIYIAESLKLNELVIELTMVPQRPKSINKCDFIFDIVVKNNKKETIGFINDDMFDDYFWISAKELKKPNIFKVHKLLQENPADEWFLMSPYYEENKHLGIKATCCLKNYDSEQIDKKGFDYLKSVFNMDSYLNEFLSMLHSNNLYDFSNFNFIESRYHIGIKNYLFISFVNIEKVFYYSPSFKENYSSMDDFENDIVNAFFQMKLIHSSIKKEDYNNLEELFVLNKILVY